MISYVIIKLNQTNMNSQIFCVIRIRVFCADTVTGSSWVVSSSSSFKAKRVLAVQVRNRFSYCKLFRPPADEILL
jgi:hypothetical protein